MQTRRQDPGGFRRTVAREAGLKASVFAQAGAVLVAFALCPARADQVEVAGKAYPKGRILGIEHRRLRFRLESSDILEIDLAELERVHVDPAETFADLNAAEDFVARGEADKSLVRYERQLRVAEGFWADLIKARLVRACDRAGQIDKAAHYFCRVMDADLTGPEVAARLMPDNIPKESTPAVRQAVEQLERATGRGSGDPRKVLTLLLKYDILRRTGDARAEVMTPVVAELLIPGEIATPRVGAITLAALFELAQRGDAAAALAGVDRALTTASDDTVPTLLLLKGRLLAGAARASREELMRAGWAFMRIVAHYGEDPRAADALLEAAEIHRRIDRAENARSLARECLARRGLTDEQRRRAEDFLGSLGGN